MLLLSDVSNIMELNSMLIFTDVISIRFNFVNTDRLCRKKANSSEKAFHS